MNPIIYLIYVAIVGLIRVYKWIEYQILLLSTPFIKKKGKEIFARLGVILHCPGDKEGFLYENELTSSDPEEARKLTEGKYDRLLHMKVNSNKFFARWANLGTMAVGETFVDGTFEFIGGNVDNVSEMTVRILENGLLDLYYNPFNKFLEWLELYAFNLQTEDRVFQVGKIHYDLGNDLYEAMLDPWMQYTCGYWKDVDNLNDAQTQKMDLIARKLDLKPGMRVLDIGCGWGTLCKYLAEKYNVECVGVTIGEEGAAYGKKVCAGLPVDIRLQDYRKVEEKFDRIVSVGMFEHVGFRNYKEFFTVARRCLKDDGLFVLHTIARNHSNVPRSEPWVHKNIFPNGNLPNPEDIAKTTKDLFVIEDWHNFGLDYAKTLFCWRENFLKAWPDLQEKYGGDQFYLMWTYYLGIARGLFLSRRLQLWQVVLSKNGIQREYRAAR